MIEITKEIESKAPVDTVWKLVSDLENEHKYWHLLKDVKILSKSGTSVEREVKIRRGPMGEAKSVQTLSVDAFKKTTTLTMTKGPMIGTRKITVSKNTGDLSKITVNWQFDMKGVPAFAVGFVKDNISDVTEKSLAEIAKEAEG